MQFALPGVSENLSDLCQRSRVSDSRNDDYGMEKFAQRFIPHACTHWRSQWLQFASELILSRYRSTGGDTVTGLSLLRSVKRADGKFWNVPTTTYPNAPPDN